MAGDAEGAGVLQYFPEGGSYQQFLEQHLLKNVPCMFGEWATRGWAARALWVMEDGSPNFSYLNKEFGEAGVCVANCSQCKFWAHPKTEMILKDYLQYWQSHDSTLQSHNTTSKSCDLNQRSHNVQQTCTPVTSPTEKLYLKDWHFVREFPEHGAVAYTTPPFLTSDWLNEVWAAREDVQDDYKFVYMGPPGTWTPFHADVLRSYSWSANITGSKEWLLFPPKQEELLRDRLGNLPFDLKSSEVVNSERAPRPIRVVQRAGEIIFVPSGWHHQVCNLENTISINHNWNNAFSLQNMWGHLQHELQLVRQELQDCVGMQGWNQQCQVILRASAGMDYWQLAQFLVTVAIPRLHFSAILFGGRKPWTDLPEGDSPWTTLPNPWTMLTQFIQQVSSKGSITFFQSGSFPSELSSRSLSDGSVVESLDVAGVDMKELWSVLPVTVKHLVEVLGCDCSSSVLYRVFELHVLASVAKELVIFL